MSWAYGFTQDLTQRTMERQLGTEPENRDDACPYSAVFAEPDFDGCPRFVPLNFRAAEFDGTPLGLHLACSHLVVGGDTDRPGPWYPRCALGGPPDFRLAREEIGSEPA